MDTRFFESKSKSKSIFDLCSIYCSHNLPHNKLRPNSLCGLKLKQELQTNLKEINKEQINLKSYDERFICPECLPLIK